MVESEDPEYRALGNIQLNSILSAESLGKLSVEEALSTLKAQGSRPYFIPSGASTHPLGGLGFARWAFEVEQQEKEMNIIFDTIIVPLASGSTLAGMIAGFEFAKKEHNSSDLTQRKRKLIGISAMPKPAGETAKLVLQIAKNTAEKLGLEPDVITLDNVTIDEDYTAGKYGKLDDPTQEGIKEFASLEGILTDPVYTGKAITGLLSKARKGEFEESQNVLFCHTGGQPALSAYPSMK
jgi:1-aminocyclopropane-1-carboxylate deaminase